MSILHVFAFLWQPYRVPARSMDESASEKVRKQSSFLGVLAFVDTLNIWDIAKGFGRAIRWLFVGLRHHETDPSYNIVSESNGDREVTSGTSTRQTQARGYFEPLDIDRHAKSRCDSIHPRTGDTLI